MPVMVQNALGVFVGTLPLCGIIFWAAFQQSQCLSRLEAQVDMLTARTNSQFGTLTARMNSQFEALTSKMDKLIAQGAERDARIAVIENKIDGSRLIEAR